MKTTRFATGIYGVCFVIDNHNLIEYRIEKNKGDYETRDLGRWLVIAEIDQPELWDQDFATKKEALENIADIQANGYYKNIPGLGWCYQEKQENNNARKRNKELNLRH